MNGVDLNRFEFDYDTTFAIFFLDAELNVYSRYGGRDHGEPEDRLGVPSLLNTMRQVLTAHASATVNPESQKKLVQPTPAKRFTPRDIPLLKASHRGCVHCHQIREYRLLQWSRDGKFDERRLFGWPLPENLGLKLDRKHGHRIASVAPRSPGAAAGLQAGDVVVRTAGVPIRSELDLRWTLHRLSSESKVGLTVNRGAGAVQATLRLPKGWRRSQLGWRKSLRSVPVKWGLRGYDLSPSERKARKLAADSLAVRITAARDDGLAGSMRLQRNDVIVGFADVRSRRTLAEFKSDLLNHCRPGDPVQLTVLRDGRHTVLKGRFPNWRTEETTVP